MSTQSASPDTSSVSGKKKKPKNKKGPIRAKARERGNTLRSYMFISGHDDSVAVDSEKDDSSSFSLAPYWPRAPTILIY